MRILIFAIFLSVLCVHAYRVAPITRRALRRSALEAEGMDLDLEQMQDIFDAADKAGDGETLKVKEVPLSRAGDDDIKVVEKKEGGFDNMDIGLRIQDLITVALSLVIAKNTFDIVVDMLPKN